MKFLYPTVLDHAVLQRTQNGFCAVSIPFSSARPGSRITAWYDNGKAAGEATVAGADGSGSVHLEKLPQGGPYEITVREDDTVAAVLHDLLVGDVWLLAGQANMLGCGQLEEAEKPSDRVRCFGFQNSWRIAAHRTRRSKDPINGSSANPF